MPHLNEQQKKKRGQILQHMADVYWKTKCPWLKRESAYAYFAEDLEKDPVKLRIINALAASTTIPEESNVI